MSNELLNLVTRGESGAAGYNAYNRGTYRDAQGHNHIRGSDGPIDFSTMTVGQVHDAQHADRDDPNRLFAVGRYQVIPQTMDGAINALNLDRNQQFTPQVQDRVFNDYLIVDKRPAIHDYITGKPGVDVTDAQRALAQEWASFGDPDNGGRSHYDDGANHASITLAQSSAALNSMREAYQADIARGMTADQAWAAVTQNGPDQQQTQASPQHATAAHPAHAASAHGKVLEQGDHGTQVHQLQADLAKLGYKDSHGNALRADSDFGPDTKRAVEKFQHDHHLAADGKAGPQTMSAMQQALKQHDQAQAPQRDAPQALNSPTHPDHALYQQALDAVHRLDAEHQRTPDKQSEQFAASLVVAARREGMDSISSVALSDDGKRAYAVSAEVDVKQATNASVAQSSATWAQQQHTQQQGQPSQQQQQQQQQASTQAPQHAPAQ
jgi:peptidoglycan hydrolase-like protein with peptidoglycan-binding domain